MLRPGHIGIHNALGGGGAKSANSFADGPLCAPHAVRHKKSKMRFLNGLGISGFRVFGLLGSEACGFGVSGCLCLGLLGLDLWIQGLGNLGVRFLGLRSRNSEFGCGTTSVPELGKEPS